MTNHLFNARAHLTPNTGSSRRDFLKQSASATAAIASGLSISLPAFSEPLSKNPIAANPIGFNAERQDHITQKYHFGNGVRMYNPSLMRFHATDSMSPFGKGGINSYAYALGDPVNYRDPSGHIAIAGVIIGIIVGAVIGASIAAVAEGIKVAVTGEKFDWKPVVIGAALGGIGGGFGAAASGLSLGVKAGLALGEAVFSGLVDFGLNVAAGMPVKEAAQYAGIGVLIGLVTFGATSGFRQMARPKGQYIKMGGRMKDLQSNFPGMITFIDDYKAGIRLNIMVHGKLQPNGTALPKINKSYFSAEKLADSLRNSYDLGTIDAIRTIMCNSATGGDASYAAQLNRILNKPVKGYVGIITVLEEHTDMFEKLARSKKSLYSSSYLKNIAIMRDPVSVVKRNPYSLISEPAKWARFQYRPVHFT